MSNNGSLTKAMINLAHDLQLDVVAEGVENYRQLSLVKQQSCDKVQGYYFSKPINYEQTVQYYIHNYLTLPPQNEKAGAN
jgi:EAL domain-containing protein (putative c-di-GMP-specific phosphodiesterase class I)